MALCHQASSGIGDCRRSNHTINLIFWVPMISIF
ncbi:hypothetical protein F383_21059 [Gossypium arboreum]|uniref:Uncharacterized protein n=1 Tax=Gossypium arboreum TaxID=29729 RepID=A0A0B0MK36_GOSAR|nr:hypothetical protein F383_21059 [Gossypium arboreum]